MTDNKKNYLLRYLQFFFGISLMGLGIAVTTLANLGTTAISALPYVASLGFSPSMGFYTALINILFVFIQILIMRKKFPKEQFLQIPAVFLFSFFIDFWMWLVPMPETMTYTHSLIYLSAGTIILALGIFIEVSADVVMMAGEGIVLVISMALGRNFGTVKTVFDTNMVLMAIALSFVLFGELRGVREGTIVSALTVGSLVKLCFFIKKKLSARNCLEEKEAY